MSAGDIARVKEGFAAFAEHGVEGLVPYMHPEFVGTVPPEFSAEPDTYTGHDGVRRYFALWADAVEDFNFAPEEFIECDGAVVATMRLTGRGRGSGLPFDWPVIVRITLRDGLLTSMVPYPTVEEALGDESSGAG
jgi:ketosteroid isomerase-like protein